MSACFPSEMADDVDDSLTPLISDFDVSTVLIFSSRKVNSYAGFIFYSCKLLFGLFLWWKEISLLCFVCKYIFWLVRVNAKLGL